mmetsp:Transcript_48759/g.159507  ORF Transcript_48759/g.159507 Transcript_48759/m.159507 type:complete len:236 (+) Transcript_48759:688-1395(+)
MVAAPACGDGPGRGCRQRAELPAQRAVRADHRQLRLPVRVGVQGEHVFADDADVLEQAAELKAPPPDACSRETDDLSVRTALGVEGGDQPGCIGVHRGDLCWHIALARAAAWPVFTLHDVDHPARQPSQVRKAVRRGEGRAARGQVWAGRPVLLAQAPPQALVAGGGVECLARRVAAAELLCRERAQREDEKLERELVEAQRHSFGDSELRSQPGGRRLLSCVPVRALVRRASVL